MSGNCVQVTGRAHFKTAFMTTDELIASLSADLRPVGRCAVGWRLAGGVMVGALASTVLSMATLGPIPKEDIGAASGFFSLTRQLGGSIGVALLTTLLAQRQTYHRAMLAAHVGASDQGVLDRVRLLTAGFVSKGYDATSAHTLAIKLLDGAVSVQAAVMSFGDTFWVTGVLFVCSLPLVLLLGKAKGPGPSMAH